MRAYWPEHKMPAIREITSPRRAKIHWDASLILDKDVACGFVATRSITTALDTKLVTCRACRSLALICGGVK